MEDTLTYMDQERLRKAGWTKESPHKDRDDAVTSRCHARLEGRTCVRRRNHLERTMPLPHLVMFMPGNGEVWFKEIWGAGAS